jgi:two-component system, NarL family, invasion response regulator UvrY
MIKVIIADDHPIVRAGMKQILSESGDIFVAGEADSGEGLLQAIQKGAYDAVLLDITMPGIGGLETLKRIRALKPDLPVLILSIHSEEQFALRTLKAGAAGYLTKSSAPAELVRAIRQVTAGRKFISAAFGEKLVMQFQHDLSRLPHERLSEREFQVLCMIANGKTVSEIAESLNLSVKTVSTYRSRILEKTGMNTSAELTTYAIRNNICRQWRERPLLTLLLPGE